MLPPFSFLFLFSLPLIFGSSPNSPKVFLDDGIPSVRALEEYLLGYSIFVPGFQVEPVSCKFSEARKPFHPRLALMDLCDLYGHGFGHNLNVLTEMIPKYLEMTIFKLDDAQIAMHFFQIDSMLDFFLLRSNLNRQFSIDNASAIHGLFTSRKGALEMLKRDYSHRKILIDLVTICPSYQIQVFVQQNAPKYDGIYSFDVSPMACLSQANFISKSPTVHPYDALSLKSLLIALLSSRLRDVSTPESERQHLLLHIADNCFFMSSMRNAMILSSIIRAKCFCELNAIQYSFTFEEWHLSGLFLSVEEIASLPDLFKDLISKKTIHEHHRLLADFLLTLFKQQTPSQISKYSKMFVNGNIDEVALDNFLRTFSQKTSLYTFLQEPKSILDYGIILAMLVVNPNIARKFGDNHLIMTSLGCVAAPIYELFSSANVLASTTPMDFSLPKVAKFRKFKPDQRPAQQVEMLISLVLTLTRNFKHFIIASLDSESQGLVSKVPFSSEKITLDNMDLNSMFLDLCNAIASYNVEKDELASDLNKLGFAAVMQSKSIHSTLRTILLEGIISMYLTRGLSFPLTIIQINIETTYSLSKSLRKIRRTNKVFSTKEILILLDAHKQYLKNRPIFYWITIWAALPRIMEGEEGAKEFCLLLSSVIPDSQYPKVEILRRTMLSLFLEYTSFSTWKEFFSSAIGLFPLDAMNVGIVSSRTRAKWLPSREIELMKDATEDFSRTCLKFAINFIFKDPYVPQCNCHVEYLEKYFKGQVSLCIRSISHALVSGIASLMVRTEPLNLPTSFLRAIFLDNGANSIEIYPAGIIYRFRFELDASIDMSLMSVELRSYIVSALSLKDDVQQKLKELRLLNDSLGLIKGLTSYSQPKSSVAPKAKVTAESKRTVTVITEPPKDDNKKTKVPVSLPPVSTPVSSVPTPLALTPVKPVDSAPPVTPVVSARKKAISSRPTASLVKKFPSPSKQGSTKEKSAPVEKSQVLEETNKDKVSKQSQTLDKPHDNPTSTSQILDNPHEKAVEPLMPISETLKVVPILEIPQAKIASSILQSIDEKPKSESIISKPNIEVEPLNEGDDEDRIPEKLTIKQLRKNSTILSNGTVRPNDFPSTPFKLFIYSNLKEGGSFPFKLDSKFLSFVTKGENREHFSKSSWKPLRVWMRRDVWKPRVFLPVKVYGELLSFEQIKVLKTFVLSLPEEQIARLQSLVFYSNHSMEGLSDSGPYASRNDCSRKTLKFQIANGLQGYRVENGWIQMPAFPKSLDVFLEAISIITNSSSLKKKKIEVSANTQRKATKTQPKVPKPEVVSNELENTETVTDESSPEIVPIPIPEISDSTKSDTVEEVRKKPSNPKAGNLCPKPEGITPKSKVVASETQSTPFNSLKSASLPKSNKLSNAKLTAPAPLTNVQILKLEKETSLPAPISSRKSQNVPIVNAESHEWAKFRILKREKPEGSSIVEPSESQKLEMIEKTNREQDRMNSGLKSESKEFVPASERSKNEKFTSGAFYIENFSTIRNVVTPLNYKAKFVEFSNIIKNGVEYIALDCEMTGLYTKADEVVHKADKSLMEVDNTRKLIDGVHENQMFQLGLAIKTREGCLSIWSFYTSPFLDEQSFTPDTFYFTFIRPYEKIGLEFEGWMRAPQEMVKIWRQYVNVLPFLSLMLSKKTPLVLFSGYIDLMQVLKASRMEYAFTHEQLQENLEFHFYDTKYVSYQEYRKFLSLEELISMFYGGLKLNNMRLHDASYDALLTALVFEEFKAKLGMERMEELSKILFKFYHKY